MKTTMEIPDELFRRTKALAALRGESLKDFVTAAIRAHVESQTAHQPTGAGWRSAFGQAQTEEVAEVDGLLAEEPALRMKRVSRRREGQDTVRDAAILQRTINRLRGGALVPRGVYRFRTHEEADDWMTRQMASTHARLSSKTS
jgi:predicted transcriptional regulator